MLCKFLISIFALFSFVFTVFAQNSNIAVSNKNYQPPPPANSTVRGRVFYENTGRPVRRASILLTTKGGERSNEFAGLTDNNGFFEIKKIRAGTYYAFVNAPGVISPLGFADFSKPRNLGLEDAFDGFQPIVVNGISDLDVEIPAKQGGAIGGRVIYSNGDPAIGVKVEVLRKVGNQYMSVVANFSALFSIFGGNNGFQTDDRGMYRFSGLPAGEYVVKATESASHTDDKTRSYYDPFEDILLSGGSLLTVYHPSVYEIGKAEILNIVPGQEAYEINITIPDRDIYRLEGKVISAKTKQPIPNAKLSIKRVGENINSVFDNAVRRNRTSSTDEQGNWSFKDLPKGIYKISVEATERLPGNSGGNAVNRAVVMNSNYATDRDEIKERKYATKVQEITLEDKSVSEIVFEMGFGATISGTVSTENSDQMPSNVNVYTIDDEADSISSVNVYNEKIESERQRKVDHNFELESVSTGKSHFRVNVSDEDYYVKSAIAGGRDLLANPIELTEGEFLRNVKITLGNDPGTIKGKIFDANKEPAKKRTLFIIPTDNAKLKNSSFYKEIKTDDNGEFTVKTAPGEYIIVEVEQNFTGKGVEDFHKWLESIVGDAPKVTVKANEISNFKVSLN